jgi:hypothetical protein
MLGTPGYWSNHCRRQVSTGLAIFLMIGTHGRHLRKTYKRMERQLLAVLPSPKPSRDQPVGWSRNLVPNDARKGIMENWYLRTPCVVGSGGCFIGGAVSRIVAVVGTGHAGAAASQGGPLRIQMK